MDFQVSPIIAKFVEAKRSDISINRDLLDVAGRDWIHSTAVIWGLVNNATLVIRFRESGRRAKCGILREMDLPLTSVALSFADNQFIFMDSRWYSCQSLERLFIRQTRRFPVQRQSGDFVVWKHFDFFK